MYALEDLIRGGESLESTRKLYSMGFVSQDVFDAFYDFWTKERKKINMRFEP